MDLNSLSLPVMIDRLPFEEYRKIKALSFSGIKDFREGPGYYDYWQKNEKEESSSQASKRRVYKLIHTLLGEPHLRESVVCIDGTWNAKVKTEVDSATRDGKIVLKTDERDQAIAVVDFLRGHSWVKEILKKGKGEQTIIWKDDHTGALLKARLDWVVESAHLFVDWKAYDDLDDESIERQIRRQQYQLQAAHYASGLSAVMGKTITQFANCFYRTKPPYDCKIVVLSDQDIEAGQVFLRGIYDKYQRCLESNTWPMSDPEPKLTVLKPWFEWDEFKQEAQ